MGFCRRCGDIVPPQATRCKCGGTPVAPANIWSKTSRNEPKDDKWSKTYTTPPRSRTNSAAPTPTKSPLPKSPFGGSVKADEPLSSLSPKINTSPLRGTQKLRDFENDLDSPTDILISPEDATLAKVFGSILQPTSDLPIHSCALCHEIFAPDATIYPDLSSDSLSDSSFLCRSCFTVRGGSKGKCKACYKDVLVVTNEGGFVEFSGNVWHKRCFRCDNCDVDISHSPMVDIFGKPSCPGCFDTCTIRARNPNRTPTKASNKTPNKTPTKTPTKTSNKTPTKTPTKTPPRKLSEVTNNLGGTDRGGRELNPALEELSNRLGIPRPAPEPAKVVDDPFLAKSTESKSKPDGLTFKRVEPITKSPGKLNVELPDKLFKEERNSAPNNNLFETCCKGCSKPLLSRFSDGKFVNAPGEDGKPVSYHVQCFRCSICQKPIEGSRSTPFVRGAKGICHPECIDNDRGRSRVIASPLRITVPENKPVESVVKELQTAPPAPRIFPRFGDSETCPGCRKNVSVMEVGVVSGPQAKRWHKACLVCGGKGAKLPRPGCGKVLDSSAKLDIDGAIWCRECLLLLPIEKRSSPQSSPIRSPLAPMHTGQVASHLTGGSTTTIARQFTGNAVGLLRSGSISPTRQLRSVSPTKGLKPIGKYARPLGFRNKSIDEGRGMFLVRQMTGSSQR